MLTENIRYNFEMLMERDYPQLSLTYKTRGHARCDYNLRNDLDSEYENSGVQLMWIMFRAGALAGLSRLKINLPPLRNIPDGYFDAGFNEGVQDRLASVWGNSVSAVRNTRTHRKLSKKRLSPVKGCQTDFAILLTNR